MRIHVFFNSIPYNTRKSMCIYTHIPKIVDNIQFLMMETQVCRYIVYEHKAYNIHKNVCIYAYIYKILVGEDAYDASNCRSLSAKELTIIGLFCRKWPIKIRHPPYLGLPVWGGCD